MKKLFLIFFFILNFSFAEQYDLLISSYKKVPGMDFQMELVLQNPIVNHRVLLDCQGFINGLYFQKHEGKYWNQIWFIMLEGNDCEDAFNFNLEYAIDNGPYCLNVNLSERVINFNYDLKNCLN